MLPKLFWTIFSSEPRMDLGSSVADEAVRRSAAREVDLECVEAGGGETSGGLISEVGGDTEGELLLPAVATLDGVKVLETEAAKRRLRSAMAAFCGVLWSRGPTHCRIWSTNRCMAILSPHFSHEILPAGSVGFVCPESSC